MNLVSFFFKDDEAEEPTEEKEELPETNGAANTALTPVVKNVPSESKTATVEAPAAIKHPETEPSTLVIHSLTETPAKTFSVKLPSSPPKYPVPGPSAAVEAKPLVVEKVASKPPTPSKSPLPTVAEKKSPKVVTAINANKSKVVAPKVNVPTGPIQTEPKPAPLINGSAQGVPKQWNTLFNNKTPQVAKPAPVKVVKPVEVKTAPRQQNGWKTAPKMNGKAPNMENGDCKVNGSADDHQAAIFADHIK